MSGMHAERFADRAEAGQVLGRLLLSNPLPGGTGTVVLGLPRGGVPVAAEVAALLDAPLDVLVVRKLGVPGHEELAMGAIASGGIRVLNEAVVGDAGIAMDAIERATARELAELERRARAYRGDGEPPETAGRTVILVDDGLATGSTMRAAVEAARAAGAAAVVAAAPVASAQAISMLGKLADQVVCPLVPPTFRAVGLWYEDFSEVSDEEIRSLLDRHRGT
jgi:putative phosphoribosyl transferase